MVQLIMRGAAVVALFLCVGMQANAQAQMMGMGGVSGQVFAPTGKAIPKAMVTLRNASRTISARTNAMGWFMLMNVPRGMYNVRAVDAKGRDSATLRNVMIGNRSRLNIHLRHYPG